MATCPNCKTDLMEVNGRYICSECGKEVPAAEINVGSWGDGAQMAAVSETPEPGSTSITEESDSVPESEDYIEGDAVVVDPPVTGGVEPTPDLAAPETESVQSPDSTLSAPEVPASPTEEVPVETGFYTATENAPTESPVEAQAAEVTPEVAPEPVVPQPVNPEPVAPVSSYEQAAPADPLYQLPADQPSGIPTTEDFYEQPLKPAVTSPLPEGGAALPQDANIFRDPMYEKDESEPDSTTGPIIPAGNNPSVPVSQEKKMNRIVLFGGIGVAILLLAGGIITYVIFSSKTAVNTGGGGTETAETDCDQAGSDTAKQACIVKAFAACDVAKWTMSYPGTAADQTRTVSIETQGLVDNQCQVDESFTTDTVNPDTVDKTMSCNYDNTTTFDKAFSTNSATNCSGDLADLIFGTGTTDNGETDTGN